MIQPEFFGAIERVPGFQVIGPVLSGKNQAMYVVDNTGRRWVQKSDTNAGIEELLAESVGWHLGRLLKAPVPDAAVCISSTERSWLSREVPNVTHWNPDHADNLINYDALGAMVTLDAIIMNADRHAENLLLEPDPDVLHLRAWAIDAGVAAVCWPDNFAVVCRRGEIPKLDNYLQGLPVSAMRRGAEDAAERAANVSVEELNACTSDSCDIANNNDGQILFNALRDRCHQAPIIVAQFLEALEAHR